MSYSASNIDSLRLIYCDSKVQDYAKWDEFEKLLRKDFDSTAEAGLTEKLSDYFNSLVDWLGGGINDTLFRKLLDCKIEGGSSTFLSRLAADLTHSFRHELLRLSRKSCKDLGYEHYKIILKCIEECEFQGDIAKKVKQALIPDPKQEMNGRLDAYIKEERERLFYSKDNDGVNFVLAFKSDLNSPNVNLKELIDRLSRRVIFKDGLMLGEGEPLSKRENVFIQSLKIYRSKSKSTNVEKTHYYFNNSFGTALSHFALKRTVADVLLLLMRLHITEVSNQTEAAIKMREKSLTVIKGMNDSVSGELTQKILRMHERSFKQEPTHEVEQYFWFGSGG